MTGPRPMPGSPRPRIVVEAPDADTAREIGEGVFSAIGRMVVFRRSRGLSDPTWVGNLEIAWQTADSGPERPPLDPETGHLLWSYRQAATALGVGERTVRRLVADGALPAVRLGDRRLIRPDDARNFVDELPTR